MDVFLSDTNERKSGIVANVENERGTSNVNAILSKNDQTGDKRVDLTNEIWYSRVNQNLHQIMDFTVSSKERQLVNEMLQFAQPQLTKEN